MKIELVSKKVHYFGGKVRKVGEKIFATEREARLLKALGRATRAEPEAPAPVVEEKPKRAYKRKDLEAETLDNVPPAPPAVRQSLVQEVDKVRESYRTQFAGADAIGTPGTLHITRPTKSKE